MRETTGSRFIAQLEVDSEPDAPLCAQEVATAAPRKGEEPEHFLSLSTSLALLWLLRIFRWSKNTSKMFFG